MSNLTGKYAIVTGAGKGIGKAIAKRFLEDGAAGVAIFEYDAELAAKTAKELDPTGKKVLAVKCDVSKEDQVAAAVKETAEKFGTIDILVNNAGITRDAMFHKMTNEQWDAVISVNLNGTYLPCKYVVPIMREKNYGKIVNISSTSAFGNIGQANYAATKGAVVSLTATLAKELGPKNITVNAIAPGMIDTDMLSTIPKEIMAEKIKSIPMKRLGATSELASAVAFFASDDSSFVTGQCLIVSGGTRTGF